MLHDITYYYQKSQDSGIRSMNCQIDACIRNSISGKTTKEWPEVKNYYDYINKCYSIAQEIPVEELWQEYYDAAKSQSKKALEQVHLKVIDTLNVLNDRDLNYMMGYTPISHVREQLLVLSDNIEKSIRNFSPAPIVQKATPVKTSFFARLFC